MGSPRVLVVEHQESCPPRLVGDWLAEAGCTLAVSRPYADDDTVPWLAPAGQWRPLAGAEAHG